MNKGSTKAKRQENSRCENEEPTRKPGTSIAEWIVAGVSCLALLAVLGYLILDGLSGRNGAADIIVLPAEVTAMNDGYVVEFAANNRAGKSVAAVEIKGELRDGEEVVEESGVTIDYIPQKSERKGALIFRSDPEGYELRIFASGYSEP
ncbi:TIGR02588 family protein [Sinorhizobium meliloti]|uniref:TIGR02588 family protein n=1 Tax=Rhizobium meliloti TaxID=382 RepID=UPI0002F660B9|nr:TIGR02588 family protein [Sinorhizobium meliloti]ASP54092.1 TIGR02588 family protein [Sinorhizobium meliloti]MDE3774353.1 TIGR02588 family protein [Sinorhizobium meliloti]MDE3799790.1 TIGR02588 family protein [Sinorhizobium meliloti]MDE4605814.1 TIGR02588 family protein [Sinorhizobium meliloti]MDE4618156.1 TIGR02588 family protein [Sinorhizobium meliloti]